jgi:predicted phage terminase large subunit-like protein
MHRLHESLPLGRDPGDDLVGHALAQEDSEVVRCAAIAEDDETQTVDTAWGAKLLTRWQGEALHPARKPLPMLEHLRSMIGEYNFAGQYQQAPTPLGGGMVKAAWFKHYAASALPQQFDRVVQSWDTANKATELSDFSVCTTWGIAGNNLYLVDLLRRRMEYPELKREVRAQYERFRPSVVLIEDRASGTQLIQELTREGVYAVTRYQPQTDKVMRMHAQTAMIENGFVHLPDAAPWLAPYLHELTVFPHGKHDDQVDSTAQLLDWFKRGSGTSPNAGIFELYRQQAEELRRGQAESERRVRLRVPPGIGHRNMLLLNVGADGTVEMSEAEAESFLRAGWVRVDAGDVRG